MCRTRWRQNFRRERTRVFNAPTYLLTYSILQSPAWEANQFSVIQEISRILSNPKVHYSMNKCSHLSLSWARSIQYMPPYPTSLRSILILYSHLSLGLSSGSFPQVSPPKPCVHTSSPPKRATYPAHLILLDLFIQTILGEEYRSLSSPLCSFSKHLLHLKKIRLET